MLSMPKINSPLLDKAMSIKAGLNNFKQVIDNLENTKPQLTTLSQALKQNIKDNEAIHDQNNIITITQNLADPKDGESAVRKFVAFLPEEVSMDLSSVFATPFADASSFRDNGFVSKTIRGLGVSGLTKEMSLKVWESSEGLTISVPVILIAGEEIAGTNYPAIRPQILNLLKMCVPREKGSIFLDPPGPIIDPNVTDIWQSAKDAAATVLGANLKVQINDAGSPSAPAETNPDGLRERIADAKQGMAKALTQVKNKIDVKIGNFLHFDNVVVNSVSQTYETLFDIHGAPIKCMVNLSFTTFFTPTVEDMEKILVR